MERKYSCFSEIPTLGLPKGREPYCLMNLRGYVFPTWIAVRSAQACQHVDEVTTLKSSRRQFRLHRHNCSSLLKNFSTLRLSGTAKNFSPPLRAPLLALSHCQS